jgi:hypothetical protein
MQAAMLTAEVVFPTPPLWLSIETILCMPFTPVRSLMFPVIPRTRQIETQPKAEMNLIFGTISELLADYNLTYPAHNFHIQQRKNIRYQTKYHGTNNRLFFVP